MHASIIEDIGQIRPADWNRLAGDDYPFAQHEFLVALEQHGCLGSQWGWLPRHIVIHDAAGELIGACPMYLKDNSYGELVFDWGWASAYEKAGLAYYPKLVCAIPYTPATGPRLLTGNHPERNAIAATLIETAVAEARAQRWSSVHWLFPDADDKPRLEQHGLLTRMACQFHWENHGYADFDAFLATFSSAKRKKLKRERRRVEEQGIEIRVLRGHELDEAQWQTFHRHYRSTFHKRGGYPTLSLDFFQAIAQSMPERPVLMLAYDGERHVASAFNLSGRTALFGRHWGCDADYHSLHFELCYYQGLDYCIRHGLQRFEPGAQGEHKISRGFLPTPVWSAHWLAHPEFADAIEDFLRREKTAMNAYIEALGEHSPYREQAD